ncbi:unnamed protein product [Rotaria sp. Silwood1]|nr:unnamed protein product [Rotaria sp. Silwood1]
MSYCYASGESSFSYILDSCYCLNHNSSSPINAYNYYQPYFYYNEVVMPQRQQPKKPVVFLWKQIRILEEHFYKVDKYVSKQTIDDLSIRTQLTPAQIRIWFNNKRTRERR